MIRVNYRSKTKRIVDVFDTNNIYETNSNSTINCSNHTKEPIAMINYRRINCMFLQAPRICKSAVYLKCQMHIQQHYIPAAISASDVNLSTNGNRLNCTQCNADQFTSFNKKTFSSALRTIVCKGILEYKTRFLMESAAEEDLGISETQPAE